MISFCVAIRGIGVPLPNENWTLTVQLANSQPVTMNTKPITGFIRP